MRWGGWGFGERRWEKPDGYEVAPAKTFWDVLQLLVVPLALAAIAVGFNIAESSRDRARQDRQMREDSAIARDAREENALQSYLREMTGLVLDRHLLTAHPHSAVGAVARSLTLSTLRGLDRRRKAEVVRFLDETGLLRYSNPPFELAGADLVGADFRSEDLGGPGEPGEPAGLGGRSAGDDLRDVDLEGARFDGGHLDDVNLTGTNLRGASFKNTYLQSVVMIASDLTGAVFNGSEMGPGSGKFGKTFPRTDLSYSCLNDASFVNALLDDVALDAARGRHIDFSGAVIGQVSHTGSLFVASVPAPGLPTGHSGKLTAWVTWHPCADLPWRN
jgi:uncharacterized protein YjbI with pentapeptide repeats